MPQTSMKSRLVPIDVYIEGRRLITRELPVTTMVV